MWPSLPLRAVYKQISSARDLFNDDLKINQRFVKIN